MITMVIQNTLERDSTQNQESRLKFKRLRPGEPLRTCPYPVWDPLFDPRRYDLAAVSRYKMNKKLNLDFPPRSTSPYR